MWADPAAPLQQAALSSVVHAMYEKDVLAIARWVARDGADPKMGVLAPSVSARADCLLWVQVRRGPARGTGFVLMGGAQMPFADDVRQYTFASLDNLVSKTGAAVTSHPYLPTEEQLAAMDAFVDAMDLMDAGEKDDDGCAPPLPSPH